MGSGAAYHGSVRPTKAWSDMTTEEKAEYLKRKEQEKIRQQKFEAEQKKDRNKRVIFWSVLGVVVIIATIIFAAAL